MARKLPNAGGSESSRASHDLLLRQLICSVRDGVWLADGQGEILFVNQAIDEIYGRSSDEFLARSDLWLEVIHPDDREGVRRQKAPLRDGRIQQVDVEYRIRRPDGTLRWISDKTVRIHDEEDRPFLGGVATDVTRQKLAERTIQENELLFRGIVEDQTEFIVRWLPDGTRTFVNDAYCRYFGGDARSMLGTSFLSLVPASDAQLILEKISRLTPDKPSATDEHRAFLPGGEVRWQQWTDRGIFDHHGNLVEIQSVGRDITERRRTEEALRLSEGHLRALMESARGFAVYRLESNIEAPHAGRVVFASPAIGDLLGVEDVNDFGSWFRNIHPDELARVEAANQQSAVEGIPFDQEMRIFHSQKNKWIFVRAISNAVVDPETNKQFYNGVIVDISREREALESLRINQRRTNALLDAIPDSLLRVRIDGVCLDCRLKYPEWLGHDADLIGKPLLDALPVPLATSILQVVQQVLRSGQSQTEEYVVSGIVPGQAGRTMEVRTVASGDDEATIVLRDITDRKRIEQERENMIRELEKKNIELERFNYTVSHDLKSPIVTIKGFLDLLREDLRLSRSEAVEDDLLEISKAAERMHRLLDELLELSRIGRIANPSHWIPLRQLFEQALEMLSSLRRERAIEVRLPDDMPQVFGDPVRLLQVVQNLLENAMKFMGGQRSPQICVGAEQRPDEILCFVRDNGIGMVPEHCDRVFGLFEQLDANTEGTGIGLALAKRIVESHGGRIWAVSPGAGCGSTFFFTLSNTQLD